MSAYRQSLWIAKLTLVLLTLLFAISGFWVARDSPSWAGQIGAMIPAVVTLYLAYRVGRPATLDAPRSK